MSNNKKITKSKKSINDVIKNDEILLDAKNWKNKDDFYSSYSNASIAPKWFGRNIDALNDSFRGGICKITPKKIIIKNLTFEIKDFLGLSFWREVEEICKDNDIELDIQNN